MIPEETVPESVVGEGLLVESWRAYLAWKASLEARGKAYDQETAARGAYLRVAWGTAEHLSERAGHRVVPFDEEFKLAAEEAWTRHIGKLGTGAVESEASQAAERAAMAGCEHPRTTVEDGPSGETWTEHCDDCGVRVASGEHPQ